jgi:hypothetical protein
VKIAVLAVLAACHGASSDGGGSGDRAEAKPQQTPPPAQPQPWQVQYVKECAYAVEMPPPIERRDVTMTEFPEVKTIIYSNLDRGTSAKCTVFGPNMQIPDAEGLLRSDFKHDLANARGLAGGITSNDLSIDPGKHSASYKISFANGTSFVGRKLLSDRQIHDFLVTVGPGRGTDADLDRLAKSYAPL